MNAVWAVLVGLSVIYSAATGDLARVPGDLAASSADAVGLLITLAASYMLWSGVMRIFADCGAVGALERLLRPLLGRLFPDASRDTSGHIAANVAANMLGLGGAATPEGLEAMRGLARDAGAAFAGDMTPSMGLFIILNCSSVQLLPTTMISLRAAAGSAAPQDITLPALATTACTTAAGLLLGMLAARAGRRR